MYITTSSTDKASDTAVHKNNTGEKSHIISNPLTRSAMRARERMRGGGRGREDIELDLDVQGKPITIPGVQYS